MPSPGVGGLQQSDLMAALIDDLGLDASYPWSMDELFHRYFNSELPYTLKKRFRPIPKPTVPIVVYGNSLAVVPGLKCTSGQEYPTQLKKLTGAPSIQNYAISARRTIDMAAHAVRETGVLPGLTAGVSGATWPGVSQRKSICIIDTVTNDIGHYPSHNVGLAVPALITGAGGTNYLNGIKHAWDVLLAVLNSETRVEAETSGALTGTWATGASSYASGGSQKNTSTAASYIEFTVTPPQYGPYAGQVWLLSFIVSTVTMSQVTTTIDGGSAQNVNIGSWEAYTGYNGASVVVIPALIRVTGIPIDGASHVIRFAHSGTTGQFFYADALLIPSVRPNQIYVPESITPVANGSLWTQAQIDTFMSNKNAVENTVKSVIANYSANTFWVPCTTTPNGQSSEDGLHLNDRGNQQRMNDLLQSIYNNNYAMSSNSNLEQTADTAFARL